MQREGKVLTHVSELCTLAVADVINLLADLPRLSIQLTNCHAVCRIPQGVEASQKEAGTLRSKFSKISEMPLTEARLFNAPALELALRPSLGLPSSLRRSSIRCYHHSRECLLFCISQSICLVWHCCRPVDLLKIRGSTDVFQRLLCSDCFLLNNADS